jgi:predicted transposase/invertase (TIGR01784 family)
MNTNTKFKDSVFSFLFSDPDILRELYGALTGLTLPTTIPLTINTLRDVLYKDRVNDISFEIGGKLVVLIEHQSTINHNMALRLLMYIGRVYEKIIKAKTLYSTKRKIIPRPEFIVLYNGIEPYPEEMILKLSDSFDETDSLGIAEHCNLELTVRVINIGHENKTGMVQQCQTLAEYNTFIALVRKHKSEGASLETAVQEAVYYCIDHDILTQFLHENASEVANMLMTEWNMDDAKQVWYEEGIEKGMETAARNALAKGISIEVIHDITGLDPETIKRMSP